MKILEGIRMICLTCRLTFFGLSRIDMGALQDHLGPFWIILIVNIAMEIIETRVNYFSFKVHVRYK